MHGIERNTVLAWLQRITLAIGVLALGICAGVHLDAALYQAFAEYHFQCQQSQETPTVRGFLADWAGRDLFGGVPQRSAGPLSDGVNRPGSAENQKPGATLGRMEIPSIGLRVMLLEGTGARELDRGVGHIEQTVLPGEKGNSGIAGHRDSYFRSLRGISRNDTIVVSTLTGEHTYYVDDVRIVDPSDVGVLAPTPEPTLTLVTCYPFYFVGAAPQRFVVTAHLVQSD